MPVSLTTLTGPIYMPNGATPVGGRVSFELSSWDREEGEALIVSGPTYSSIDENGQFSVELFTTTEGANTVNYKMYVLWEDSELSQSYVNNAYVSSPVPHYTKKYIGSFALAGAGPFQVSDLNIVSELELNSFDVLLECQAYSLVVGASVDLAEAYAQTPEDTEVPGGAGYSALHYAAKAGAAAAASAVSAQGAAAVAVYPASMMTDRRRANAPLAAPPALAQINHVMQIGQSLAIGSNGTPIIHATPLPANMLTFAGGPKAIPVAAGGSAPYTASFKAMVEDMVSPDGGGSRGETGLWNAAYALAEALAEERASTAALGDFVFTAPGIGGQSISYFAKSASGSSWWQQRFRAHILAAQAIATAAGKTFCVPVIFWAQGEANAGVTSTEASYATALRTLFTDMADEVLAITGQTQRPHFVTYFTGYGTLEGHANTTNRAGTLGQLKTLAGALDVHQGVPVYALPHAADGTHLTAEGYAMMGRAFGEALADIMVRNRYPRQVWPVSAIMAEGCRNVVVKFRAPEAGVERDDTAIPATTNAGFVVHDGAGVAATISGVTIAGDEVTLALADYLPSLGAVRYACDTRAPAVTDPVGVSVATGNLRAAGYDLPVHGSAKRSKLWCPPFIRSIQPPPSGLVWPGFEAVGAGGGHWLFDQSGGHLTDRVNARVITDNGGLSAGTKGLAISGVFGQGGTTDIDDAAQLTICAVVLTNNDYGLVAGALTGTSGSALLRTQTGGHAFSRTSGGSRTAAQNPGAVSGDWRFMSSVEDFAATDLRVRCANLAGNTSLAGVTKVLNTVNKIGIGSRYWNNTTYNKPVELVELIIFPSALSAAQITEVYQRSVARIALSREVAVK